MADTEWVGEIQCFLHIVWPKRARQSVDVDCAISIVLFGVSKSSVKNWEVLARRKFTDNLRFSVGIIIGLFLSCKDFPIF